MWARSPLIKHFRSVNRGEWVRPRLADDGWTRIDSAIDKAVEAALDEANLEVVVVLTSEPAEDVSSLVYVWFEPEVDVVIALSRVEKRVSVSYTNYLWSSHEVNFKRVEGHAGGLLKQDRLEDASISIAAEITNFPPNKHETPSMENEPQPDSTAGRDEGLDQEPEAPRRGLKRLLAWFHRFTRG